LGLLLLAAPAAAQAQFGCVTNADNTLTITNYTGTNTVAAIPTNINNLLVTGIGAQAFYNSTNLAGITIPTNVTSIGDDAFAGCPGLTNVTLPDSITNIGVGAFEDCASLTAIGVDTNNSFYSSTNGVLFDKSQTTLIEYPGGLVGSYSIPTNVTSIGDSAFYGCTSLTNVVIPDSVTGIGSNAFYACAGLTSIVIPGSVTNIGDAAFEFCTNLTNVVVPAFLTSIGAEVFEFCASLTSITIPTNVTSIGDAAFYGCASLTNVVIPDSVTNIAAAAFHGCTGLTNVVIPSSIASIGAEVFELCASLTNIVIPGSVTNIGYAAFYDTTSLASITIPSNVTDIGSNAFDSCSSLTNIVIPASVTNIGDSAFEDCSNLVSVNFTGNAPAAGSGIFASDTNVTLYYVPGTTGWSSNFAGLTAAPIQTGSLQVTITPSAAIAAGAQWQIDGGPFQNSGVTVTNLLVSNYTVSFNAISNWTTPPNQTVSITNGATTTAICIYTPAATPSDGLILLTNGFGTIQHGAWPKNLMVGRKYTVTAMPKPRNVFANWVSGTNQPYSSLSSPSRYTFTMQSNLLLEANFVTNFFLAAHGTYRGLFAPENSARQQTNSGSFSFNVTSSGAVSGNLDLGGQSVPFSGKFNLGGTATNLVSKREPSLTTTLQLDFADQSVSGTVNNSTFTAALSGYRDVFSGSQKATNFEGQYTLVIPGTTNPSVGPSGVSYGTVKVGALGTLTLAGSLADGTAISQSSVVSQDGLWPLYVNLYGGKGSLWGTNYFTNHTLTNASALSWINETNSSKTAVYRSGFTNQQATLIGGLYISTNTLTDTWPADLLAILEGGDLPVAITNGVTLAADDKIALTNSSDETNKLTLTVHKSTGVISGSFANPADTKQTIKVNGVILQGRTNAQGYFLGTNLSGTFLLVPP
jgi:hypothetical protein